MPYFDTKNGIVYAPDNQSLNGLYELIKKHQDTLGNSRFYEDLIDVYETLDFDLKEDK
jgi:hypothetical protein